MSNKQTDQTTKPDEVADKIDLIKEQVLKHVKARGRILLHWRRQPDGFKYPLVFVLWLAEALDVDPEEVCRTIIDMIDSKDVALRGNMPFPLDAPVFVEHVARWQAVNSNPAVAGKCNVKASIVPAFTGSGKSTGGQTLTKQMCEAYLL